MSDASPPKRLKIAVLKSADKSKPVNKASDKPSLQGDETCLPPRRVISPPFPRAGENKHFSPSSTLEGRKQPFLFPLLG